MEQIQVTNNDGHFDCNINITTEEWFKLLNDPKVTTPITWKTLLGFYQSPNHSAACSAVSPDNPKSPNPIIRHWGERIQEKLNRFQVLPAAGVGYTYWIIPMTGFSKGSNFVWTVRPELVQAIKKVFNIQDKLILDAIEQYKHNLEDNPFYWDGKPSNKSEYGEKYKWEAISHFQDNWDIDAPDFAEMFKESTSETRNLLEGRNNNYKWYPRGACIIFAKHKPDQTRELFQNLFDENIDLKQRIIDFIQKAKELREEIKLQYENDVPDVLLKNYQNTNAISTYLWLNYPKEYYKYAPDIYYINRERLGLYQYCINKKDGTIDAMLQGFAMYDKIRAMLKDDKDLVEMINSRVENLHLEKDFDDDFRTATIDFGYFVSRSNFHSNIQQIQENSIMSNNLPENIANYVKLLEYKKNVILQGAPGTGKTYSTAAIALGLLGVKNVDYNDHAAVMEKYNEYFESGNIFFTTFHQSMDYEDFVEGLKPKIDEDDEGNSFVTYEVEDGIFKDVCNSARGVNEEDEESDDNHIDVTDEDVTVWKVSLGARNGRDNPPYPKEYCIENNFIWVWGNDKSRYTPYHCFKRMKKGDIVLILKTKYSFEAIGIITSDDFTTDENSCNFRNVKWITTGADYKISPRYQKKRFTSSAVYCLRNINRVALQKLIDSLSNSDETENNSGEQEEIITNSPVILIIDEINRGNVSKFFGELVTLLEKDKREGEDHPITVTLPYSKEEFSVPSNVYIIGTMNTTDRSTGTIDYAIRRRFAFVTLKADEKVLPENSKARALFNDIKSFIENDKNHPQDMDINDLMVGHSYFMAKNENELKYKIQYEVIPLLKEYLNDGLLTCSQKTLDDHIKKWVNLELFGNSETPSPAATEQDDDEDQE